MRTFRSRVSVVLLLILVGSIAPAFIIDSNAKGQSELAIAYGILFGSIGLVLALLFSMRYCIDESNLYIKLGPISFSTIPLNNIQKVEHSYNPLSSPASSLKRLFIKSEGKEVLISPSDEDEFIRLLKTRNQDIQVNVQDNDAWWKIWNWDI
jgi:membrane protein YdbS with pleckstrin-like domain